MLTISNNRQCIKTWPKYFEALFKTTQTWPKYIEVLFKTTLGLKMHHETANKHLCNIKLVQNLTWDYCWSKKCLMSVLAIGHRACSQCYKFQSSCSSCWYIYDCKNRECDNTELKKCKMIFCSHWRKLTVL